MITAVVGVTYERAKLLARELGIENPKLISAHSPRVMDGLRADRWLIEDDAKIDDRVLATVHYNARKMPGGEAIVRFVRLTQWTKNG